MNTFIKNIAFISFILSAYRRINNTIRIKNISIDFIIYI